MPEFRFTTSIDGHVDHADEAMTYPTEKAATDAAQDCLVDMARDKLPNGKHAQFAASVTDEAGREIYRARMVFHAQGREEILADDHATEQAFEDLRAALAPAQSPQRAS